MEWLANLALTTVLMVGSLMPVTPTPTRASIALMEPQSALLGPISAPALVASSAEVTDLTTGQQLYSKNTDQARPMASLTKLMTALVIMREKQLTDVVQVPADVENLRGTGSQALNIIPGDKLTVEQALNGLLVYSANDVAVALATWDAGSEANFVTKMNQTAQAIGLKDSHFVNATGLDAVGHVSSTRDLTTISRIVLQSPTVRTIADKRSSQFTTALGHTYKFTSTNQLLVDPNVHGLKTGYTSAAGECLITYATQDEHAILTVVLGSTDRFGDSANLITAAFKLKAQND